MDDGELKVSGERTVKQYTGTMFGVALVTGESVLAIRQNGKLFEMERLNRINLEDCEVIQCYISSYPLPEKIILKHTNICQVTVENIACYMQQPTEIILGEHPYYLQVIISN